MAQFKHRRTGDVITVFGPVADHYGNLEPDWDEVVTHEEAAADTADLRGEALNQALQDAGLPTSGKADEKRQLLADHLTNEPHDSEGEN